MFRNPSSGKILGCSLSALETASEEGFPRFKPIMNTVDALALDNVSEDMVILESISGHEVGHITRTVLITL